MDKGVCVCVCVCVCVYVYVCMCMEYYSAIKEWNNAICKNMDAMRLLY